MNRGSMSNCWPLDEIALRESLVEVLGLYYGSTCPVRALSRQPYAYRTSFPLEDLVIELANGAQLRLLCKCTSWNSLTLSAQRAKPRFLHDPLREIETYRLLLAPLALGTPIYYGSVVDPMNERYLLFLEKVTGTELYQVGDFSLWQEVARWLAAFHDASTTGPALQDDCRPAHLLQFDDGYLRRWIERAVIFTDAQNRHRVARQRLHHLAGRMDKLIERLDALPLAFLHGEFYASNILIQKLPSGMRIAPVDWELSAIGPSLIDLAALVAGHWRQSQREDLALAYRDALVCRGDWPPEPAAFLEALDVCRLLLAIQWLGWSEEWSPPREHSHDWLADALDLAERLAI